MDYYIKYKKYKTRYLQLNTRHNTQFGGILNKRFIIADGTSSAGKTTLCKHFIIKNYKCIMIDDYFEKVNNLESEKYKTIKNEYVSKKETELWYANELRIAMINDAIIDDGRALFDDISQKELLTELTNRGLQNDVYIIVVYTNLDTLARNLEFRRKEGDRRGIFAFHQFSERYIKTDNQKESLDTINRNKFVKLLLDNFKYEFENEIELNNFANDVFKIMNIENDDDNFIKLRDEYKYNYILDTTNKTKEEIFEELSKIG